MNNMLEVANVEKIYPGKVATRALHAIRFTVQQGQFVGIMGPSGSGKTTLLNLVSTIDKPSSGTVTINGLDPQRMNKNELARFRRQQLGFVFQDFNLMDTLTVEENIVLPLTLDHVKLSEMDQRLAKAAARLGIEDILGKRVYEISGGQRQRTAIARAIIAQPSLILADEPTGSLDSRSSRQVMESLASINRVDATTVLLVTHDPLAASYCDRILFIKDGELAGEIQRGESRQAFFQQIIDTLSSWGGQTDELSSIRL